MRAGDIVWSSVERLQVAADTLGIRGLAWPPPAERIGLLAYCRLGQRIIAGSGHPELGLVLARNTLPTHLGYPGLAAMTAPTLGDALHLLTRYEPLNVRSYRGQSLWQAGDARLSLYSLAPYDDYTRFIVDGMLGTWFNVIAALTGTTGLVQEVHIEFAAPAYHAHYMSVFGRCPVYFAADENALQLTRQAAATPLPGHDRGLHAELLAHCDARLRELERGSLLSARVQKVLGPLLRGNSPSLEEVAGALNMPAWTLRRKLREENTTYQDLLDEMRRDLALAYIRDMGLSQGEIAYVLGFSSAGAFQRAFKRWTGRTPGDFRKGSTE